MKIYSSGLQAEKVCDFAHSFPLFYTVVGLWPTFTSCEQCHDYIEAGCKACQTVGDLLVSSGFYEQFIHVNSAVRKVLTIQISRCRMVIPLRVKYRTGQDS